jgi:hypothetical protein
MTYSLKSILAGAVSGIITTFLAVPAIGVTAAIAMPSGWPVALWSALVVFGLGAFLPALVIQSAALLITRAANAFVALASFCIAAIATIAMLSGLTYAGSALAALVIGSVAATATVSALWSNNSFKPTPLRGAA